MDAVGDKRADVVIVWAVDRLVRRLADLEMVIDACEASGVKLATVSGDLDLSTDQGPARRADSRERRPWRGRAQEHAAEASRAAVCQGRPA
jgi:DNA invertase Pin-like site-specific DNA recombinase